MKKHILGALIALPAAAAHAGTATLDPIVTTASRTATPVDETVASVTVIDSEEIAQAQANDMGELLRGVTGIDISRYGGPGQPTSVFLRGSESDHTLVLIDGVAINPGTLGNAALQSIDPRLVERIEIVRGPLSSLYGSAAIGGVINIITRGEALPGEHNHVAVQAGSYDSLSLNAGTRMAEGALSLALDLSHQQSEGFPTVASSDIDRGADSNSISAHLGYRMDGHTLRLQAYAVEGTTEYASFGGTPIDQDVATRLLRAGLDSELGDAWTSRLNLSRMQDLIDQNQANYLAQFDYAHTTRDTLDWQNDLRLSARHLLTAGVTLEQEHTDALSYDSGFDVTLNNQAFYVQEQYGDGPHTATAALRWTRHDSFGDHLTWNLGYGHRLSEATRLRASAGTAFRAPSGTDLYGYGGNPALEPEQSRGVEIGINHRLDAHSSIDLAAYHSRLHNLIVTNFYDLDGIDQWGDGWLLDDPLNENVGRASISGLEIGYRYSRRPWLLRASAEFKRPWDESNDVVLSRRARVAAKASLLYSRTRWDAGLELQYEGKRDDSLWNSLELDAYTLANATARWYLDRNTTVEGRIENLFDADYELAGGYNTPGRSIYLGLRVESD
jgi:vitamin B12 transporter